MAGSITPLPVMMEEEEIEREKQEFLKKQPPESVVVRYSYQKKLIELKYEGETTPGCGTKFVIRSPRGIELAEMVTTVCPNGGCGHAVTRKQMRTYIDESGGKDFPFTADGRMLREATREDELEQQRLDELKPEWIAKCKSLIDELNLDMKLVDVEPLLGGERVVFYYLAENYVDFRELVTRLGSDLQTRVEMVQLNAREEARIVADYEKCGQHCCCKQFLKVLKPVSMRSAKVQKATLDPSKISGRCGRLMCCLRYEDKTYSELKKNLPHRKTIVETPDGVGTVLDGQILTQLVLVRIPGSQQANAYPIEDIRSLDQDEVKRWKEQQADQQREAEERWKKRQERKDQRSKSPAKPSRPKDDETGDEKPGASAAGQDGAQGSSEGTTGKNGRKRGRSRGRRRRRGGGGGGGENSGGGGSRGNGGGGGGGGDGGGGN